MAKETEEKKTLRTIEMKWIGKISAKPDYVEILLYVDSFGKKYDEVFEEAGKNIQKLIKAVEGTSFKKTDLKTRDFELETVYDTVAKEVYKTKKVDGKNKREKETKYEKVFKGYKLKHRMRFNFDFDMKNLAKVLSAFSECKAKPEMGIAFTVKDKDALNEELLAKASKDAKKCAETIITTAGAKLGKLLKVDYNWPKHAYCSRTRFDRRVSYSMACMAAPNEKGASFDIEPDEIKVSDSANFTWEIE
ncbi:MAG: SIMPL domain-containing protein [Phascolarctobacterium sp.]|nr:SIMPL domain-containing protein [Phascolarctobacterium sp.]